MSHLPIQILNPLTYAEYRNLVERLVLEEKATGPEQTQERIVYTKLNLQRMKRGEKQIVLLPALGALLREHQPDWRWLVLVESWCGDAAQTLPAIAAIAAAVPTLELVIVLRDQNPHLMDTCLTNGSRSIPKLICEDRETGERLFTWGSRPETIQQQFLALKAEHPHLNKEELMQHLHTWYAKDRAQSVQLDLLTLAEATLVAAVPVQLDWVI
ncbi:thioredoxin family protein [Rufibacter quisquiliarum]|uniref:Thioredoxin n=1 Tax=Rufibacter quisquiliarum TaxID=1549639 RepID=A0A839GL11_9BACT|nr:thioredoxin family protein [Rufibacter quisquiliarum]MBA9075686.1 hypothetical protein [Rufibacter quisquiliarum]